MDLDKAIKDRRSIRRFSSQEVTEEQVRELLEAGTLAPSAKNRQHWQFYILRGEKKDRAADITQDAGEKAEGAGSSVKGTCRAMREAPVLILVAQRIDSGFVRSDLLSIGACVENICLKATELGLGSLWICDIDVAEKELQEEFSIDSPIICAVSVGYAAEAPSARPRLGVDEVTKLL